MRNIITAKLPTAMNNIAMRIRMDLVMHVAFVKEKQGGHHLIWITEAGDSKIIWQVKFVDGWRTAINLPEELITEKE